MNDFKTVEDSVDILDPLYQKQREDVAKMRASLLVCTADENPTSVRHALNQITNLRIYHQLSRIIKYLDMMDKIEDKLYESIDNYLLECDVFEESTLNKLLSVQSQLQKAMIESHKLLDIKEFATIDLVDATADNSIDNVVMNTESRDRLRSNAQAVLAALNEVGDCNS